MKKYWKKFKYWLIRKLGGHPIDRAVSVTYTQIPVVTVEAFVTESQDCRYSNYIKEVLMHNLAEELSSFVEIDTCTNPMEGTITYRARIKVAKPNN